MPVLGYAGVVSPILNCILKLTSATPNADICSRCVLRAAELDPRGHKRASSTDPHGHCEAQKAVGIDGSLVAARIKLSSP